MNYRKLRIAGSALCGILCFLLIALWARSYWYYDDLWRVDEPHKVTSIGSNYGTLFFYQATLPTPPTQGWKLRLGDPPTEQRQTFSWLIEETFASIELPYWSIVPPLALLAVFTAVPLAPWSARFSLRTLLIAMTLFAVVLGVVTWATRSAP